MNTDANPSATPAAAANDPRPAPVPFIPRTRKQIQSAEMAEQSDVRARWKTMLPDARTTWPKVPAEELLLVRGNIHKLAGMVQLRYRVSREEADQQVKTFMTRPPISS